jgi:hypothetical protein
MPNKRGPDLTVHQHFNHVILDGKAKDRAQCKYYDWDYAFNPTWMKDHLQGDEEEPPCAGYVAWLVV